MTTPRTALRRLREDVGELLERHDEARDLREFESYADDPVGFVREVLGEDDPGPWEAQVRIAEAVRDHPLTVVRSANAVGKDWIAARLALWWVYARRGLALVTGPTQRQVTEIVMGEVARAFRGAPDLPGELFANSLRLPDEEPAGILAFTSSEASRLTGFHAPRVLAVLTEAQGVEPFAWEGVLACATGAEDRILAVGNPLAPSGRFYAVSGSAAWRSLRIPASEHPNIRTGETVIPGGPSPAFVERIRREYGADSGVYAARVEGRFPETAHDALVRQDWLEAAVEAHRARTFADEEWRHVLGVDVARYGRDASVVCIRRGRHVVGFRAWRGQDTKETASRVLEIVAELHDNGRHPVRRVVVDVVGIGAGVADQLREKLGTFWWYEGRSRTVSRRRPRLVEFNAGAKADEPERFTNARASTLWHLRKLLEDGEIALPPDEALLEELRQTRVEFKNDGRTAIESKDQTKGRIGGRSPDRLDALAMSFAGERRTALPLTWGR